MRVLVTGAAGYLGDAIVENLLADFHEVVAVDNLMYVNSYMRPGVTFFNCDITSEGFFEFLEENIHLLGGNPFDCIINLAAIVGDGACQVNPGLTKKTNSWAVREMVDIVKKQNPKCKFIQFSTCSVYGMADGLLNENSPTNPLSLYASSKLEAESYVEELDNYLIFRLGTLFGLSGPFGRIRTDLVANIMTYRACSDEKLQVFGGEQYRPLLAAKDVGVITAQAVNSSYIGKVILSRANYTIHQIAKEICETCGGPGVDVTEIKFEDQRNYRVDSSLMSSLGFAPQISLRDGVSEMAEYFLTGRIKNPWVTDYNNARIMAEFYK